MAARCLSSCVRIKICGSPTFDPVTECSPYRCISDFLSMMLTRHCRWLHRFTFPFDGIYFQQTTTNSNLIQRRKNFCVSLAKCQSVRVSHDCSCIPYMRVRHRRSSKGHKHARQKHIFHSCVHSAGFAWASHLPIGFSYTTSTARPPRKTVIWKCAPVAEKWGLAHVR